MCVSLSPPRLSMVNNIRVHHDFEWADRKNQLQGSLFLHHGDPEYGPAYSHNRFVFFNTFQFP